MTGNDKFLEKGVKTMMSLDELFETCREEINEIYETCELSEVTIEKIESATKEVLQEVHNIAPADLISIISIISTNTYDMSEKGNVKALTYPKMLERINVSITKYFTERSN